MFDNLNNYKAFFMVAKTGSISKAANALYISQPAISKSISKLEEGLNVKLFERGSKGVVLTAEGEVLYGHIKNAFEAINKGEDEIHRINTLGLGQIRIGVSTSLCKHFLLEYLKGFILENPHVKVIINCHSTFNTLKLLQAGDIDIGLICHTDLPGGFKYHEIAEIHDIFIANQAYIDNLNVREQEEVPETISSPWLFAGNFTSIIDEDIKNKSSAKAKNSKNPLTTKDILEKSNLMLLESTNITRLYINEYLAQENINPAQILEINNMDLLIDFASIGMGIASVVREFAKDALDQKSVIELPLEKPIKARTVGFAYPENKSPSAAFSKFLDYCRLS